MAESGWSRLGSWSWTGGWDAHAWNSARWKPTTDHLQSRFVRQSFGSLDVLLNEGLPCIIDFKVCTMTAVRLPRLSRPGVLESISPKRLFALLQPYADFFANRCVPIKSPDSINCRAIIREITNADQETPADLLDAICLIDELANPVAVELLLDRVPGHALGLERGGEHSPADIVTAASTLR